ncbi:MAG: serine hydrolase domain-containing protein [Cyanobacteria bacterium P01_E01_bin.42]
MNKHKPIIASILFSLAFLLVILFPIQAQDYQPVRCSKSLPYEGKPLYRNPIDLPKTNFSFNNTFEPETIARLDSAFGQALELTQASVITAAIATPEGFWETTRKADDSPSSLRLYWASVGKTLTATAIVQLVEEGKLSLNDPLSQWLPDFPNASSITIDHLLQHTGGIFSFNEASEVRENSRYYSPTDAIALSADRGAMFCPGQFWRYSNTGYTLLGQIIERLEGRPYADVVNQRISDRLDLATLRSLTVGREPSDIAPLFPPEGTKAIAPSWPYAAGNAIASAADMVRFWHALLTGQLLQPESVASLFEELYPMFDDGTFYGRGVMLYALPDGKIWLGHSGGTPGAKAVVAFSPSDRAFVAVALTGDGSAEATANLLLQQLKS